MRRLFIKYRKHIWIYIGLASVAFLFSLQIFHFRAAQIGLIYPNIYIGDINFGGKTPEEAKQILDLKIQDIMQKGVSISVKGQNLQFGLFEYGNDPDLSHELIKANTEAAADAMYSVGRSHFNLIANLKDAITAMASRKQMELSLEFAGENFANYLKHNLQKFEVPSQNATIAWDGDTPTIITEKVGLAIDYNDLINKIKTQVEVLEQPYAAANLVPDNPEIRKFEVERLLPETAQALSRAPLAVKYNGQEWPLEKNDLKNFLNFEKQDGAARLVISKEKSAPFFATIAKSINIPAQNAKFTMQNGKVTEFATSRLGTALDEEATRAALNSILLDGYPMLNAIVRSVSPDITNGDLNQLGISELLGTGTSNFKGSPPNRVHNIKTGAGILNGILIKPGEEFSLIKALGAIDGEAGFKPEMVIKEGRTVPEYGGGLCQIGTTVFRTALISGLPITERRNHSYRVAYYEPAGTDATIYNPSPDLKFINDTPGYILVQTKMSGNDLSFEFWGQKDGREITQTNPVIYNIVAPPEPKYIPTAELEPGVKKKIETAHSGADAYFKYTVKYPDERGEISKTFTSHYQPWAEVWLVGAELTADAGTSQ